jgi:N-methylhydantoinase A/oxoprolinase/acetone carboxylase beta subunit
MDPHRAGIPLDPEPARQRLGELVSAMSSDGIPVASEQELLEGLRRIAIEKMAEAIRTVTVGEGALPDDHVLLAFGGAGPQHACALADRLGMKQVVVPGDAGLLSARGLDRARRQETATRQILRRLTGHPVESAWMELQSVAMGRLGNTTHRSRWMASLCLEGQGTSIEVELESPLDPESGLTVCFHEAYQRLYGFPPAAGRGIELVSLRVIVEEEGSEPYSKRYGRLPNAYASAAVRRGSRPMVARYQVIGSLLRLRPLSLAFGDEDVMARWVWPSTMGDFRCGGLGCQQRFRFQSQFITKEALWPHWEPFCPQSNTGPDRSLARMAATSGGLG